MDIARLQRVSEYEWVVPKQGRMRVPAVIYASAELVAAMDEKVYQQATQVAMLPGIVGASYAMPDAHWGYGFPIGGVAAFDAGEGGVVSAGGVGFDISCGVRTLHTGICLASGSGKSPEPFADGGEKNSDRHTVFFERADFAAVKARLADALYVGIPAGVGSSGRLRMSAQQMDAMLQGGARWALDQGYGEAADLERTEEHGCMAGADPAHVSEQAKRRQRDEMGTLGSGNHYLEVQRVARIFNRRIANAFGLKKGDVLVSIHCGSRGLGHQVGTEYLREMLLGARADGIELPDRELACAPLNSVLGKRYLGAMRAAINCALANRQILTHLTREIFRELLPGSRLTLLYDVSHNTCKEETHEIGGVQRRLFVHRKGATRAFGRGHPDLPAPFCDTGQPVLIGGSMGTASYVLAGGTDGERAFGSACHGAGRAMSRHEALRRWNGRALVDELRAAGILIRSPSMRGVAEEAPQAYKDVGAVVESAERAGLARIVARLEPLICIKG